MKLIVFIFVFCLMQIDTQLKSGISIDAMITNFKTVFGSILKSFYLFISFSFFEIENYLVFNSFPYGLLKY